MTSQRKKKVLKIVHPIWGHCAMLTDDPYWIGIYTTASYGKMPKNFVYSNGVLGFSKVKKYRSINIPQNPSDAFIASMTFFKENGLSSERDMNYTNEDEEQVIPDGYMYIESLSKSKKKRKVFIELIISDFAHRYCTVNSIMGSRRSLYAILISAYRNKCLNEVNVQNGHIVGIVGLEHTPDGKIVYQSNVSSKVSKAKYIPTIEVIDPDFNIREHTKVDLMSKWVKLVDVITHNTSRNATMAQNCTDNSTVVSATE